MGGQSLLQSMHRQTFRPTPPPHLHEKGVSHFANTHPVLPATSQLYPMALGPTRACPPSPFRLPLPRCPSTPGPQGHVSCSGVPWVADMAPPPPLLFLRVHQPTPNTQGTEQANTPCHWQYRIAAFSRTDTARRNRSAYPLTKPCQRIDAERK